jgi:hypothetical protein
MPSINDSDATGWQWRQCVPALPHALPSAFGNQPAANATDLPTSRKRAPRWPRCDVIASSSLPLSACRYGSRGRSQPHPQRQVCIQRRCDWHRKRGLQLNVASGTVELCVLRNLVLGNEITIVKTTGADCIHWNAQSRLKQTYRYAVFVPGVGEAISGTGKLEHPPRAPLIQAASLRWRSLGNYGALYAPCLTGCRPRAGHRTASIGRRHMPLERASSPTRSMK